MNAGDHSVGFANGTAFIGSALKRFVCNLAPDLTQPSSRKLVMSERISVV
jgi:hypothetical protein